MAELGAVERTQLRIGQACYEAVLVPPAMENWTSATLQRIEAYLDAGGIVYACAAPPAFVDGRPNRKPVELARRYPIRWKQFADGSQMVAGIRTALPPRISRPDGSPLPNGLCWRRHERPDGSVIYFFCHPWNEPCRTTVKLEGRSLIALDTVRGTARRIRTDCTDGGQILELDLPACGHALIVTSPQEGPPIQEPPSVRRQAVEIAMQETARLSPNVLAILFCDLAAGETAATGVNTTLADELNWKAHGLAGNIWSLSSQFRRTLDNRLSWPGAGKTRWDLGASAG